MLPEENLLDMKNEQRFQSTISMQQRDSLNQYYTVFVFDKKMLLKSPLIQSKTHDIDANSLDKLFSSINDKDEQLCNEPCLTVFIDFFLVIEAKLIK